MPFDPFNGMDLVIAQMISTATIAIALFGIVFCLMQTEHIRVSRSFALFLAAVALNNMPEAFSHFSQTPHEFSLQPIDIILWLPSSLSMAPLFWIYVSVLTSPKQRPPARLYLHGLLPATAVLTGLFMTAFPEGFWATIFLSDTLPPLGLWSAIVLVVAFLEMAVFPQMAIYLILIVRRMMRYRLMLRDYYASTEQHELRWIYVIGALGALFWLGQATMLVMVFDPETSEVPIVIVGIEGLVSLGLVGAMTLWGLRQRPPLLPDVPESEATPSPQASDKYEKSALNPEASARIARKLRVAMEKDHLHRDPNLSLWILARHIGASPNYISQTLNEAIGESFFDFVNGYRIADAKTRLSTTNDTVLTITYDVGFNARSSFYNAFKRVTGQTPTGYRNLSQRDGMDDNKAGLSDF